jgi:hypothetical protein
MAVKDLKMSSPHLTVLPPFNSGGFELFLPPTPFSQPPEPAQFIMLDDVNQIFYDVRYRGADSTSWTAIKAHQIPDPAIVFPPNQWTHMLASSHGTGFLVSIESREREVFYARMLGTVNVAPVDEKRMNWGALRGEKGPELPAEMKSGLLRHVWDRRSRPSFHAIAYETSAAVLNRMPRPWHRDGAALNYELDHVFAGCLALGAQTSWCVRAG